MKGVKFIRKSERVAGWKVDGEAVGLLFKSEVMEGILVELDPMTGFEGSFRHNGEEMHLVLEGEVQFTVGGETFLCQEGDVLWHESDLEHRIQNPGVAPAVYLTILAPPAMSDPGSGG
jgi:mannose-6-phosphate isomerase-like protein (cupin superfamily)